MTSDPVATLDTATVGDDGDVRVTDVRCRARAAPAGAAEAGPLRRLVLPLRGVFSCVAGGEEMLLEPGSGIVLEPGEGYRFGHPVDGGDQCLVLAAGEAAWAELAGPPGGLPAGRRLVLAPPDLLRAVRLRTADRQAVPELAALTLGDLAARGDGHPSADLPPSRRRVADRAAEFLAVHYAEPLPRLLDAAAAAAGCSPYHLARAFRAAYGVTLHAYRERLRTAAALRALAEGADDLATLAVSLGYAHHGHFTRRLRRALGAPPSRVRDALRPPLPASPR